MVQQEYSNDIEMSPHRTDKDRGGDDRNESNRRYNHSQNYSNQNLSQIVKTPLNIPKFSNQEDVIKAISLSVLDTPKQFEKLPEVIKAKTQLESVYRDMIRQKNADFIMERIKVNVFNPKNEDSRLNVFNVGLVKSTLETIGLSNLSSTAKDNFDAVNMVMDSYAKVYEKVDARLAKQYQTLAQNFRYSPKRVADAQKRYSQAMNGKRFKLSQKDQQILNEIQNMKDVKLVQENASKLNKVSKNFGRISNGMSIFDLVIAFRDAQNTKKWDKFGAKVGAAGAGMLISRLVTLAVAPVSLPVAVVAATIGAIASYYFSDDKLWEDIIKSSQAFLEK